MLNREQIIELLLSWDNDKVIELHNTRCEIWDCMEDYIYQNTEDNVIMCLPPNPYDAFINGIQAGDTYFTSDKYFYINGYGNLESFSDPTEKNWIIEDTARWLANSNKQREFLELGDE